MVIPDLVQVDGGPDLRDPHLSTIGGDVWLTYFVRDTNGTPTGARAARSTDGGATFGPSVRVDPNLPYAAISSPVVKVDGKLMTAFYARETGENVDTAWAAWSTDNGQNWESNRIANGIGANYTYTEPWVVTDGTTAVYLFRDGDWNRGRSSTVNTAMPHPWTRVNLPVRGQELARRNWDTWKASWIDWTALSRGSHAVS